MPDSHFMETNRMSNSLRGLAAFVLLQALVPACLAYEFVRASNPPRTIVRSDTGQWRATFTDGSYTVRHSGPTRVFAEPVQSGITAGDQTVTHNSYVRVMTSKWPSGGIPTAAEVDALLARTDPDVFAVAMQYIHGAPTVTVADSNAYTGQRRISGDAAYGPDVGADFNDHLGVDWNYGTAWGGTDNNENSEYGRLDCSGFVRMVFGYRMGMTLAKSGDERPSVAIARTSAMQADSTKSTGVSIIAPGSSKPTSFGNLAPGDLVFFDSDGPDGTIDHVGIYLGVDDEGNDRVLSSRNSLLGPTMKDSASGSSPSILNGSGWMPSGLRSARRL
jgi:cell wall-associated NlpC family hydrolase